MTDQNKDEEIEVEQTLNGSSGKSSKKKKFRLDWLLVGLGALIIAWPFINTKWIQPYLFARVQNDGLNLNADDIRSNRDSLSNGDNEAIFDFASVNSLSSYTLPGTLDPALVIGNVILPTVDVNLPVLAGTNNDVLNVGIGTMKKDQQMGEGNYALAGHNSRNPDVLFAPIRHLEENDEMIITDKDKVYTYRMIKSEVVEPEAIEVINDVPGQKLLTLVSCFSRDGSDRIIVTGELVSIEDFEDSALN